MFKFRINKLFICIFVIIFSIIFIGSLFLQSNVYYKQNSFISLLGSMIICLIWLYLYKIISKIDLKKSKKKIIKIITFSLYFLMISVFQIISFKYFSVKPGWDFGVVYDNAYNYVLNHNRLISTFPEYFQLYPNNIMLFVMDVCAIKAGGFFHISSLHSCWMMNIVHIDIALIILIIFLYKKYNFKVVLFSMIVSLFFIPLFLYSSIFYSDTLSLYIPILLLLLLEESKKQSTMGKKYVVLCVLIGIFTFIGKEIKITSIFILFGFILDYINLKQFKRIISSILIVSITFLICTSSYKRFIVKSEEFKFNVSSKTQIPYAHWIVMGLEDPNADNSNRNAYGGYNKDDVDRTIAMPRTNKYYINEYIRRFKMYGINNYFKYLLKKAVNAWGDGFYYSDVAISINRDSDNAAYNSLFKEKSKYFLIYFTQGVQFSMLICLIFGVCFKFKNKNFDYIRITILGLLIFLLFWENRSRYLFNYIPIFILIITEFYYELNKKYFKKKV